MCGPGGNRDLHGPNQGVEEDRDRDVQLQRVKRPTFEFISRALGVNYVPIHLAQRRVGPGALEDELLLHEIKTSAAVQV